MAPILLLKIKKEKVDKKIMKQKRNKYSIYFSPLLCLGFNSILQNLRRGYRYFRRPYCTNFHFFCGVVFAKLFFIHIHSTQNPRLILASIKKKKILASISFSRKELKYLAPIFLS